MPPRHVTVSINTIRTGYPVDVSEHLEQLVRDLHLTEQSILQANERAQQILTVMGYSVGWRYRIGRDFLWIVYRWSVGQVSTDISVDALLDLCREYEINYNADMPMGATAADHDVEADFDNILDILYWREEPAVEDWRNRITSALADLVWNRLVTQCWDQPRVTALENEYCYHFGNEIHELDEVQQDWDTEMRTLVARHLEDRAGPVTVGFDWHVTQTPQIVGVDMEHPPDYIMYQNFPDIQESFGIPGEFFVRRPRVPVYHGWARAVHSWNWQPISGNGVEPRRRNIVFMDKTLRELDPENTSPLVWKNTKLPHTLLSIFLFDNYIKCHVRFDMDIFKGKVDIGALFYNLPVYNLSSDWAWGRTNFRTGCIFPRVEDKEIQIQVTEQFASDLLVLSDHAEELHQHLSKNFVCSLLGI